MTGKGRKTALWASGGAAATLVAGFLVTGLLLGPAVFGSPSRLPSSEATLPPERHLAIGDSETHGDVTITLVEASFSSSRSQLVFDIEDHLTSAAQSSRPYLILAPDPGSERGGFYSGFSPDVYPFPKVATQGAGPHATRNTVTLGPVEDADKPVVVHIDTVTVESQDGGRDVKGPWHFEFTPGQAAVDPIDFDVTVAKSACADGICIAVDRVHFSTSAVQVHYRLEPNLDGFRGAPGYPVRMILPDGTWSPGVGESDPSQAAGAQVVSFDPLPKGTWSFKLAFGPYVGDLAGPFEVAIPVGGKLPSSVDSVGQQVSLDYGTRLASDDFVVKSLAVDREGFELTLENVNPGVRSVVHSAWGPIQASDDRGNIYHPASLGWALGEDALGSPQGAGWAIRFSGPLDLQANVLRLTMDRLGKLLYGPWEFDVTLTDSEPSVP